MKKLIDLKYFKAVCGILIATGARTATKYIDPNTVVRATWRFKPDNRNRREEIVVTFGTPNYLEAEFIKRLKKAGEPFPVKKIQIKHYPIKK